MKLTSRRVLRCCTIALAASVGAAAALALAQNRDLPTAGQTDRTQFSSTQRDGQPPLASGAAKPAERLREGTRVIDEIGTFQNVGDRIAFLRGDDKDSYRVLENLALQRISIALDEGRSPRQWIVSGVITEFKGSNYLLVTKAVLREAEAVAGP
jgi:hypothetical protein